MWFPFALASAILYSSMWLFARGSKGLPSSVVTAINSFWGPPLFLILLFFVPFPWREWWWYIYLPFPFLFVPLSLWGLTHACQRTEVTIVNPLSSLSTIAALATATFLFTKNFSPLHITGIGIVTLGLLLLYHGRWSAWRTPWPWLTLGCVITLGINAAVLKEVLLLFPHPIALLTFATTGTLSVTSFKACREWNQVKWSKRIILYLAAFSFVVFLQDMFIFLALSLGPAPHVIAVKRTSILLTTIGGYIIFKERGKPLMQLLISCMIVAVGVIILNL